MGVHKILHKMLYSMLYADAIQHVSMLYSIEDSICYIA